MSTNKPRCISETVQHTLWGIKNTEIFES